MAAIMPHLEEQHDPSETREERLIHGQDAPRHGTRLGNLYGIEVDPVGSTEYLDTENRAVQVAHSNLLSTTWARRAVQEQLEGVEIHAEQHGRDVVIVCSEKFGDGPMFNRFPPNIRNSNAVSLLGWTSKMGCPSYSLPAGPPTFGGSCPGSVAGVSISEPDHFVPAEALVRRVTNEPTEFAKATCEFCYALKANYRYSSKQLASVVLFEWTKRAVDDGSFVEVLDWAVKNANFKLKPYRNDGVVVPAEERGKFFRIHDAGDFYSREYIKAWKAVANLNPDVTFWAPTRIWGTNLGMRPDQITALSGGIQAVNEINNPPNNLIIRPSTYMVNSPVPPAEDLGPGWGSWTTVYGAKVKPEGPYIPSGVPYNWDCQTYNTEAKGHTCRAALAPDGKTGCRACWRHTDLSVNYTLH